MVDELVGKVGKPNMEYPHVGVPAEIKQAVAEFAADRIDQVFRESDKAQRDDQVDKLRAEVVAQLTPRFPDRVGDIGGAFESVLKTAVRRAVLDQGIRPDGRRTDEIRPIWCEVGVLPRAHGSAIFTRGQTQALSIVTLGTMSDHQKLDGLGLEDFKRYMHHYNFPPYSVGEARPLRSPGRREIGHGALAERAVKVMVPPADDFPYVIRIVSEILSSNGSTSMASVCGSTLALMDAGVPLAAPVGGIAMGLVTDENDPSRYAILSDIQGMEDALGDMDFKVAGTRRGVTALQMDMKARGLSSDLFRKALEQARQGRLFILDKMAEALADPRQAMSTYAPRITTIQIHPDKIRDLIGPGGKTIRRIQEETGCQIDIEDDGKVFLATVDEEAMERAVAMIRDLTESVEVGRIYKGKVVRIMPFGAFVEILPRQDGLVHISQLADQRVGKVEDVVNIGDEIMVKVTEIDDRGRVNLSRKQAILELAGGPASSGNGAPSGDRSPGA
jgi:polyribonucleotide nucleotidyltransferase